MGPMAVTLDGLGMPSLKPADVKIKVLDDPQTMLRKLQHAPYPLQ